MSKLWSFLGRNKMLSVSILMCVLAAGVKATNIESNTVRYETNITASTVMVTNSEKTSGGSGSVVTVRDSESEILTNAHVCKILAKGGLVTTTHGRSYPVNLYKIDDIHDLCLIVVLNRLPNKAVLSPNPPGVYERATTSGHPALLPNVITEGHFSENIMIELFMGVTPCTAKDIVDYPEVCFFFGGIPIIKNYLSTLVTTLIMPGSSGSAVYNSNRELTNVIFAGSGGIGYGFAVPYEYVSGFLGKYANNQHRETFTHPTDSPGGLDTENPNVKRNKIREKCLSVSLDKVSDRIKKACRIFLKNTVW